MSGPRRGHLGAVAGRRLPDLQPGRFIALWALAVVVGWRIGRRLGIALLVGGIVVGALLVPWYLSVRGQALGGVSQLEPGQILIASDQQRLGAWAAAGRMFLDQPLIGQGYRAYRQLSVEFGDHGPERAPQ